MLRRLEGKNIEDVISIGFVDKEDGVNVFYSDLRTLYFEFDNIYLKFESINQYSTLKVNLEEKVNFEYEIDEDMEYAISSIIDIVLIGRNMKGNILSKIIFYKKYIENNEIYCNACEIYLKNGQVIFLDPSFLCGISIGGIEKRNYFLNSLENELEKSEILFK